MHMPPFREYLYRACYLTLPTIIAYSDDCQAGGEH